MPHMWDRAEHELASQMLRPQFFSRPHTSFGADSNTGVSLGLRWVPSLQAPIPPEPPMQPLWGWDFQGLDQ